MNEEMNKCEGGVCPPGVTKGCCRCPHHMTLPVLVIAVGIILLLSALDWINGQGLSVAFALLVIIAGILMILKRSCRCCCKEMKK
jgi:hypothetical protein